MPSTIAATSPHGVMEYVNYHYDSTRKKMNMSGQYSPLEDFINGKLWLVFYNDRLTELGDSDFNNAAYADLPTDVFSTSGSPPITHRRQSPVSYSSYTNKQRNSSCSNFGQFHFQPRVKYFFTTECANIEELPGSILGL